MPECQIYVQHHVEVKVSSFPVLEVVRKWLTLSATGLSQWGMKVFNSLHKLEYREPQNQRILCDFKNK